MEYKYGIDFGTTNSSIALRFLGDDEAEHTLVFDVRDTFPRETIPSVALIYQNGEIVVGEDALNRYSQTNSNKVTQVLVKKIKLDLERDGDKISYKVGNREVSGIDIIAAILSALRNRAQKVVDDLEIEISGVVMGVPVQYGDIQKNLLKKALVKAGYYSNISEADKYTEFVSEPVAVAVHYGLDLSHDTTVMVFDFGGGTLDVAIVNLKQNISKDKLHPHKTISKDRLTLGGEELNRLFSINSFCNPRKYGTKRISMEFGFGSNLSPDKLWNTLQLCDEGVKFISAVEKCKCDLSHSQKSKFSYIGRNIQLEEKVFYRDDFSDAITDKLDDIETLIDKCMQDGNITDPYDIDYVILAGGSSMIPAVQNLLTDKFGINRVSSKRLEEDSVIKSMKHNRATESEVLTSIVRGLAIVGCKDESLIDDVVDCNYGVWDSNDYFVPIIKKGTPVKETLLDRITQQGVFRQFKCSDNYSTSIDVDVFQETTVGYSRLGTINIPNPGGRKYKIYMQIDRKSGMLEVVFYDVLKDRWIDEIPLNERQYVIK